MRIVVLVWVFTWTSLGLATPTEAPVICGGGYYEFGSYHYSILDQSLISDQSLVPFLRCMSDDFCTPFGSASGKTYYDNIEEWKNYFKGNLTRKQVTEGIYTTSLDDLERFRNRYKEKDYKPRNALEKYVMSLAKPNLVIDYLWLTKKCQTIYMNKW